MVLGLTARTIVGDWEESFGYRPVLLESLVDAGRFNGTCCQAANWIYVGKCDRPRPNGSFPSQGRKSPQKNIFSPPGSTISGDPTVDIIRYSQKDGTMETILDQVEISPELLGVLAQDDSPQDFSDEQ